MWILTTTKKLRQKLQAAYEDGFKDGRLLNPNFKQRLNYHAVVGNVTAELNELEKNTWDKDRVARIKKLLMMGLPY